MYIIRPFILESINVSKILQFYGYGQVYNGNGDIRQPNKFDGEVPKEVIARGNLASTDAMVLLVVVEVMS